MFCETFFNRLSPEEYSSGLFQCPSAASRTIRATAARRISPHTYHKISAIVYGKHDVCPFSRAARIFHSHSLAAARIHAAAARISLKQRYAHTFIVSTTHRWKQRQATITHTFLPFHIKLIVLRSLFHMLFANHVFVCTFHRISLRILTIFDNTEFPICGLHFSLIGL